MVMRVIVKRRKYNYQCSRSADNETNGNDGRARVARLKWVGPQMSTGDRYEMRSWRNDKEVAQKASMCFWGLLDVIVLWVRLFLLVLRPGSAVTVFWATFPVVDEHFILAWCWDALGMTHHSNPRELHLLRWLIQG